MNGLSGVAKKARRAPERELGHANIPDVGICLFFTFGQSLELWQNAGFLNREARYYSALSRQVGPVIWITYGASEKEARLAARLGLGVASRPGWVGLHFYSVAAPLIHWKLVRKVGVLKTNQMPGAWTAVIAKFLGRKPLIIRCGYEWLRFMELAQVPRWKRTVARLLELLAYTAADAILLTSEGDARFVRTTFPRVDSSKIRVLPNFVDTDLFRPMDGYQHKGRLIYVGRLAPQKNLPALLRALELIDDAHLLIVGRGPSEEALRVQAATLGERVKFLGSVPHNQLPRWLNSAEVFVLPSLYEGHPKALIEAMACGLPVIAGDVPGVNEVVQHEQTGLLCRDLTPQEIAKAIRRLLQDDRLRQELGQRARHVALERFSMDAVLIQEAELIQELLARQGGRR